MAGLAGVRLRQGRYAEAAALAEAGTKRWSLRSLNWQWWGEALLGLGNAEGALAKFRLISAMETPSPEYLTGWARALAMEGGTDEALAKFAEAEKIDPANARNYLHWGKALKDAGRAAEGDALIAKATALAAKQGLTL
jgi:tetratricopeptide (TPR) repeat protein